MLNEAIRASRAAICGHLEVIMRDPQGNVVEHRDLGRNMILNLGKRCISYLLGGSPGSFSGDIDTTNWKLDGTTYDTDPINGVSSGSMSYLVGRTLRVDRIVIGSGNTAADADDTILDTEELDPKHDASGFTNAPTVAYTTSGTGTAYTSSVTITFKLETDEGNLLTEPTFGMKEAGLPLFYHYDSSNASRKYPVTAPTGQAGPGTAESEYNKWEGGLFARRVFSTINKSSNFEFEFRWTITFAEQ